MKRKLIRCLFLLFTASSLVPLSLAFAASAVYDQAAPSQAYFLLADDIANLFQQLEKLPTVQATTLLRQKSPPLLARLKQVRPAYRNYLKSLSAQELQAENERVAISHWGNYFAKWEIAGLNTKPKLNALMKPNSPSGQTMLDLMGIFDGI